MSFNINHTLTSPINATSTDLTARILIEASRQQDEQHLAEIELLKGDKTRRSRHWSLVNATRKFMMAADVVDFYHRRYYGTPAVVAPYTASDAERDILNAGIPRAYVRSIMKGGDKFTPALIAQRIATYKAEQAAIKARQQATLARISA